MLKYTTIQFKASANIGASVVSKVFTTLPKADESLAYCSLSAAQMYCSVYKRLYNDGRNYNSTPTVTSKRGVVTFRPLPENAYEVSLCPEKDLWTVDFGEEEKANVCAERLIDTLEENKMSVERFSLR